MFAFIKRKRKKKESKKEKEREIKRDSDRFQIYGCQGRGGWGGWVKKGKELNTNW